MAGQSQPYLTVFNLSSSSDDEPRPVKTVRPRNRFAKADKSKKGHKPAGLTTLEHPRVKKVRNEHVAVSPLDPEVERRMRYKIQDKLSRKYNFIDKMLEKSEKDESQESLGKSNLTNPATFRNSTFQPSSSIPGTPTNSRDSARSNAAKRKRSPEHTESLVRKFPRISDSDVSVVPETPENVTSNAKKRVAIEKLQKSPKKVATPDKRRDNNIRKPYSGKNSNVKFNKFSKASPNSQPVGGKANGSKFTKNAKLPDHRGNAEFSKGKLNKTEAQQVENRHVSASTSRAFRPAAEQTPEFLRVPDADSAQKERKERRRQRNIAMNMRTRRGQPVMRGRLELMLEKIKSDLQES